MRHFAVVTTNMELVLDIVGALEQGGHRVEVVPKASQAMALRPAPEALILDAASIDVDPEVRAWSMREQIPVVLVGPAAAEQVANRLGARFIERPPGANMAPLPRGGAGRSPTDPEPLWPLVLLDTLEATAQRKGVHTTGSLPEIDRARFARAEAPDAKEDAAGLVLVVEDDDAIRAIVCEALGEFGFRTQAAADGVEALETLRQGEEKPSVILMDLMMPRMNGWELQHEIAQDPELREIPVVITSVLAPARELKGHVLAQLHKPMDLHKLIEIVGAIVPAMAAAPARSSSDRPSVSGRSTPLPRAP